MRRRTMLGRRFRLLCGFLCFLAICMSSTLALLGPEELNAIDLFLEIFMDLGGERLLEQIEKGQEIRRKDHVELDDYFGLPCLLGVIRFNKDAVHSVDRYCYDPVRVCLEQDEEIKGCSSSQSVLQFTGQLDATGNEFRYMNSTGSMTANFHGVFFLDYLPPYSSILNFAQTKDGGTLSPGYFSDNDEENINLRMRVPGDRNWAFESALWRIGYPQDTIYEFSVTEGGISNPTRLQIFLSFTTPVFPLFRFHLRSCFDWLFKYDLILSEDDKGDYGANSVVWLRTSTGLFFPGGNNYFVLQIIDGNGDRIEPAYQYWIDNQRQIMTSGFQPNVNFFVGVKDGIKGSVCNSKPKNITDRSVSDSPP